MFSGRFTIPISEPWQAEKKEDKKKDEYAIPSPTYSPRLSVTGPMCVHLRTSKFACLSRTCPRPGSQDALDCEVMPLDKDWDVCLPAVSTPPVIKPKLEFDD